MKASGGLVCQGVIDGEDGKNGYNAVAVPLYRRSSSELNDGNRPSGTLTYTFSTGKLTGPSSYFNGWSQNIPTASANTKLYVIMAVAHSQSDTDDIAASDWSTPVEYVKDGEKGDNAVVYELVPDVNVINADADGNITTGAISVEAYKIVGSERSVDLLASGAEGYTAQFAIDNGSWTDCTHEMASGRRSWYTYIPVASVRSATSRIKFRLLDGNNTVCGVCPDLTIVSNGGKGDKGRMFYLAGTYDSTKLYQRTDDVCPIVYYENGSTKEYWYLDAATAQGVAPSDVAGNPWKKAENFGITITEALFANFGKLGAWVYHNKYQISQYGVDGTNNYTNFTDENGNWKPVTLLNALSGLAWFGGGKIRFNPDGSGQLAGGNISWTPAGVSTFNGVVNAQGGTFNNITAQGGTFADISVTGMIRTPFQNINTNALNFDNKNGYYAITGNVTQIGFQQELEYEGMEMTILNMTNSNSLLTIVRVYVDYEEDLDNSFFYKGTKVRYVRLSKGHHITIKAIRRKMIFPNSAYDNCIWVIMNDSEFDLGTFGSGTYNKAAISKT